MERKDLRAIEGLTDDQINAVLVLHQKDVSKWNIERADLNTRLETAQTSLTSLTDSMKDFGDKTPKQIMEELNNWETKYNNDMAAKDRSFAAERAFDDVQFSSKFARKAAMAEFNEKQLEFKDGAFVGFEDFIKELRESDPTAFITEEPPTDPAPRSITTGIDISSGTSRNMDPLEAAFRAIPGNENINII